MTDWHLKSKRKASGGVLQSRRRSDKKLAWRGSVPTETEAEEKDRRKAVVGRGKTVKVKALRAHFANVTDPETKKTSKAEILTVVENEANKHYARRSIITKGAIIKIKLADKELTAKVTSRPGQSGTVGAIIVKEEK